VRARLWQIDRSSRTDVSFLWHGALTLMFGFWRATFAGTLIPAGERGVRRGSWAALGVVPC